MGMEETGLGGRSRLARIVSLETRPPGDTGKKPGSGARGEPYVLGRGARGGLNTLATSFSRTWTPGNTGNKPGSGIASVSNERRALGDTGINLPGPRALGGISARLTTSDSTEEGPTGTGAIPGTGVRTKGVSKGAGAIPGPDEADKWDTEMWGEKETLLRGNRVESGKIISRVDSGKMLNGVMR